MSQRRILLADNKPHFRATRADFLKKDGRYEVFEAGSPAEARRGLTEISIHLAILDLRLEDDDDELDFSGILLAQEEEFRSVPKLILTQFPRGAREALNLLQKATSAAVYYLEKTEGWEIMLAAVEQAFAHHVHINFDLRIELDERQQTSWPGLVSQIERGLSNKQQLARSDELEDLFRRLFYDWEQIKIGRVLWQRGGRVAITVYASSEKKRPEWFVVVCGQKQVVLLEAQRCDSFAPKALGLNSTTCVDVGETVHYATRAYVCAGATPETVKSLTELPLNTREKTLDTVFGSLFGTTLANWQQSGLEIENKTLGQFYCERLGLTANHFSPELLSQKLDGLNKQLARLQIHFNRANDRLIWSFNHNDEPLGCVDPLRLFCHPPEDEQPALASYTSGCLALQNILTDGKEKVWLTDFADAGRAPQHWNFVELEADLRFDRVETDKLPQLLQLEDVLCNSDFRRPMTSDSEKEVLPIIIAISKIRGFTDPSVAANPAPYHLGLFFQAFKRLAQFDPAKHLSTRELTRYAHQALAMTMLSRALIDPKLPKEIGIRIDINRHQVWVNGRLLELFPQSFNILCYLYEKAGIVCTRQEIIINVLKTNYNDQNKRHLEDVNNQLNTAMLRLRQDLGEGQIYLKTIRDVGYKLELPTAAPS
ncbi:MAG: winged helix-turn-helix domain-containing protein [Acidobacteria bacterium]|nr:winged helix-turn-helix domain-containing protein [Acidobacteriota bacterium]